MALTPLTLSQSPRSNLINFDEFARLRLREQRWLYSMIPNASRGRTLAPTMDGAPMMEDPVASAMHQHGKLLDEEAEGLVGFGVMIMVIVTPPAPAPAARDDRLPRPPRWRRSVT